MTFPTSVPTYLRLFRVQLFSDSSKQFLTWPLISMNVLCAFLTLSVWWDHMRLWEYVTMVQSLALETGLPGDVSVCLFTFDAQDSVIPVRNGDRSCCTSLRAVVRTNCPYHTNPMHNPQVGVWGRDHVSVSAALTLSSSSTAQLVSSLLSVTYVV